MPEYSPDLSTYLWWGVSDVFHTPYRPLPRQHEGWTIESAKAVRRLSRGTPWHVCMPRPWAHRTLTIYRMTSRRCDGGPLQGLYTRKRIDDWMRSVRGRRRFPNTSSRSTRLARRAFFTYAYRGRVRLLSRSGSFLSR